MTTQPVISATISALQTKNATVSITQSGTTYTVSAPTTYPGAMDMAALPVCLCWPEDGSWRQAATGDLARMDRTFRCDVFVGTVGQGISDEIIQRGILLMEAFGSLYLSDGMVALQNPTALKPYQITFSRQDGRIEDTGMGVLRYMGIDFHGFSFRVKPMVKW
jgi:hypothetical protein